MPAANLWIERELRVLDVFEKVSRPMSLEEIGAETNLGYAVRYPVQRLADADVLRKFRVHRETKFELIPVAF